MHDLRGDQKFILSQILSLFSYLLLSNVWVNAKI